MNLYMTIVFFFWYLKRTLNDGRNLREVEGERGRSCVFPEDPGQVLLLLYWIHHSYKNSTKKEREREMKESLKRLKILKTEKEGPYFFIHKGKK